MTQCDSQECTHPLDCKKNTRKKYILDDPVWLLFVSIKSCSFSSKHSKTSYLFFWPYRNTLSRRVTIETHKRNHRINTGRSLFHLVSTKLYLLSTIETHKNISYNQINTTDPWEIIVLLRKRMINGHPLVSHQITINHPLVSRHFAHSHFWK